MWRQLAFFSVHDHTSARTRGLTVALAGRTPDPAAPVPRRPYEASPEDFGTPATLLKWPI